jgi:hypothetical protein
MFISQAIIAVVFRLFNFGLVIALAAYAFKHYVLPGVFVAMAKQQSEKEFLLSQQLFFEQKQVELDQLTRQEVTRCHQLKLKLEKKYNKKMEWRKKILLQDLVARKVVSDLQVSLSEYFENEKASANYLEKIIHDMNERLL